jgi:uncharacterized membrane protein YuzA (DUF378 family)
MGILAKVCALVVVFGAANWITLNMLEKDTVTAIGGDGSILTHGLMGVVGLASLFLLYQVFKPKK